MASTPKTQIMLYCENCSTEHVGDYAYTNKYGQVCYSVEGACDHNDILTTEVATGNPVPVPFKF